MKELLFISLSPDRPVAARLEALHTLREHLRDEEVVHELARRARVEESVEVRRAMLGAIAECPITRLKDRGPWLEALVYFASMEPEADLRRAAIAALGPTGHGEEVIAETLVCDLDETVQVACLGALAQRPALSRAGVERLVAYAARAPVALRGRVVAMLMRLDRADQERGLLALLTPWEPEEVRAAVLGALAALAALSPATAKALVAHARNETSRELRRRAVEILANAARAEPALFPIVLEYVERHPDHAELAEAFRNRLASVPGAAEALREALARARSPRLKIALLDLLGDAAGPAPLMALADPSPWVRDRAVALCAGLARRHPEETARALVEALERETDVVLREGMAGVLGAIGRLPREVEDRVVALASREQDPGVEQALARAALAVAIDDHNRDALVAVYRRVLLEPFFDDRLQRQVLERLKSVAYGSHPELAESLKALMERSGDIAVVDDLHDLLRTLEPDAGPLAGFLLKLFFRFAHHYARDPLHRWVKEFKELAAGDEAVAARIPYVATLTGATWILEGAATKSAFMDAMRAALEGKGGYRADMNLLDEAWKSRALRRADLVALFERLLETPGREGLMQRVMRIMAEGKLVTPAVIDRALAHLRRRKDYEIRRFLEECGPLEPSYRERVFGAFTQEAYDEWCRLDGEAKDGKAPPRTWNDWEYQGWRCAHPDWPVADLAVALGDWEELARRLEAPPAAGAHPRRTLQYLILERRWRYPGSEWTEFCHLPAAAHARFVLAAGRLARATAADPSMAALRDRAVVMVRQEWRFFREKKGGVTPELEAVRGEANAELARLAARFGRDERYGMI
jgi:DNA-binding NarL/FixJ family response regulator